MIQCPQCGAGLPEDALYCSGCGSRLSVSSRATRIDAERSPRRSTRTPGSSSALGVSGEAAAGGRFSPGDVLLDRYRVIGLLGRGGMGEVYRADDLKLDEAVALKFLPSEMAEDRDMMQRFLSEVRIARVVSHPNVCRVFDIGEVEGHPFISMEFIDGENLASLQKRIGRLSKDKASEIARQVCAGLAAAHDKGVIHRDLKPRNIMIDGRGRARITDFGLASFSERVMGHEARSGTPAYMAPEQLAGREATAKSDLYSLGLVIYELFTGKQAFEASSLQELIKLQETPDTLSRRSAVPLDPSVERAVMRCLNYDPDKRPRSALAVAASLPGGNPLAEALAAGETPPPEVLAAAGGMERLRPAVALGLLFLIGLGLAGFALTVDRLMMFRRTPLDRSPEVLVERTEAFLAVLGYSDAPVDQGFGLSYNDNYLRHVRENDTSPNRWDRLREGRPAAISFWYRRSPSAMEPWRIFGVLLWNDPPQSTPGMISVRTDTHGRLLEMAAVPSAPDSAGEAASAPAPDWSGLFEAAGLDLADFRPVAAPRPPPVFADVSAAWEGHYPDQPDVALRVEAGAYRGRPNYFKIREPWDRDGEPPDRYGPLGWRLFIGGLFFVIFVGGGFLARRNLRKGRGDNRGAFRVGVFVFLGLFSSWLLEAHKFPTSIGEWGLFGTGPLALALPLAFLIWLLYLALEPYARRIWPECLLSWSRLLDGRFRDPLIGRDILIGILMALLLIGFEASSFFSAGWLGQPPRQPVLTSLRPLLGAHGFLGFLLDTVTFNAPFSPIFNLAFILLLRVLLRRTWLALAMTGVIALLGQYMVDNLNTWMDWASAILGLTVLLLVLLRFGLFAVMVGTAFILLLQGGPAAIDFSAWYSLECLFPFAVTVAVALYGCAISLGGQSFLNLEKLEENLT